MDRRAEAARALEALFPDGGRRLLREAGLEDSWEGLLARIPAKLLTPGTPALVLLGRIRDQLSRAGEGRAAVAMAEARHRNLVEHQGPEHPDTLLELGALGALADRDRRDTEALKLLHEAWSKLSRAEPDGLRLAVVAGSYGVFLHRVERLDEAERMLRQAWEIRREVAPDTTSLVAAQLGELRLRLGRAMDAVPPLRDAWQGHKKRLGPSHPRTLTRARTLVTALTRIRRLDQAVPVLRELLAQAEAAGDEDQRLELTYDLARALNSAGPRHREEAFRLATEVGRLTRARGDDPDSPAHLTFEAMLLRERGHLTEAEGLLRECLEMERRLYGDASVQVAIRYAMLGHHHAAAGRAQEALGYLDASASMLSTYKGTADSHTRTAAERLVNLLIEEAAKAAARADRKLSIALLRRAGDVARTTLGHGHSLTSEVRRAREALGFRHGR